MDPAYALWIIASALVFAAFFTLLLKNNTQRVLAVIAYVIIVAHGVFCDNLPAVVASSVVGSVTPVVFRVMDQL